MGRAPLTTSDGRTTQAIYGMINMLKRLLKESETRFMAVVMDAKGKTFRHEKYPLYKANRPSMPDDLRYQKEYLERIIPAMGLTILSVPGVEADDVIGTLALQGQKNGFQVEIISSDKDLAQLVNDDIVMLDTMKNTRLDKHGVQAKFGVPPELITDYLALIGDTSDNIPGIPKVGPKTAASWLEQFGNLDEIKNQANSIPGKVGENLRNNLEQLNLAQELVTIDCNVELSAGPNDLRLGEPDQDSLKAFFEDLEFRSWLGEITAGQHQRKSMDASATEYETILDECTLDNWIEKLEKSAIIALDTETTSLDPHQAELVGLSFSTETGKAAYIPFMHSYVGAPAQLPVTPTLSKLKEVLEDPERPKTGQNLKFDLAILRRYGISVSGVTHDTMLMSYVLDASSARHDLSTLARKHLNQDTQKFSDIAGTGKNQLTFDQIPLETATHYAAEDADITLQLHHVMSKELEQHENLNNIFAKIELPLMEVLIKTESNGVKIDAEMLRSQSAELASKLMELERQAHQLVGKSFNMNSPSQIQEILYSDLELPVLKKTPKGQPSTAESVLQELAIMDYELPEIILKHRGLAKLKSTYTDKLPALINPRTGRIHTSYHQAVASTGRLSSSDPNLQNIPVRTDEGRRIREAFVAEPDHLILSADYSQIELRIMAHLSGDEGLMLAFHEGSDVHAATAAEVFGVEPERVDDEQRRRAKAINFGLIYGMTAFGLARQLGISQAEAKSYIDIYFERYPGVREYMDRSRENARNNGYVGTLFGRRLNLPDIRAKNPAVRQYAERTAINAPMQGTAADLIKLAMIEIDQWQSKTGSNTKMIMQVHDELVFEVPDKEVSETIDKVREIMCNIAEMKVPLAVDVGVGANWKEAH